MKKKKMSSYMVGLSIRQNDQLKRFLAALGICPDCRQQIIHDMDEPFAGCGCPGGQGEWTSKPPLMMELPDDVNAKLLQLYTESFKP